MALLRTRSLGMLLLGLYLLVVGLGGLVALPLPQVVLPVLALLAGVLVPVGR